MDKVEYKILEARGLSNIDTLDEYGKDGWILVDIVPTGLVGEAGICNELIYYYFYRPIVE